MAKNDKDVDRVAMPSLKADGSADQTDGYETIGKSDGSEPKAADSKSGDETKSKKGS